MRKICKISFLCIVFVVFLCSVVVGIAIEVFPLPNNIIVAFMLSWMIWVGIDSKKEKRVLHHETPYVLFLCPKQ